MASWDPPSCRSSRRSARVTSRVAGRRSLRVWSWSGKEARYAIEVKLRRDTETELEALDQIARYLDRTGLDEG